MKTLSQNVTSTLRDWILHGHIKAGERIEELPIAKQLGVSRTPVRAALATLASEGLIDHEPNRGYSIRNFDIHAILAAYEVRSVLEGLACRSAAQKGLSEAKTQALRACLADGDRLLAKGQLVPENHRPYQKVNVIFHDLLLDAAENPWVARFAKQAHNIPYASDRIILWDDHAVILRSHGDHHRILESVVQGDGSRAEQLMREHVYYAGLIFKKKFDILGSVLKTS